MGRTIRVLTVVALCGMATAARAQTEPPARPRWVVDHGALFCSLIRANGPAGNFFAIRAIPGMDGYELLVSDASWRSLPITYRQMATLTLSSGGESIEARTLTGNLPNGDHLLAFDGLDASFLERFAQSTRLQVSRGARTAFAIDFPRAGRAVEALRSCVDQTLTDWGIDPAARARLRSLPVATNVPFGSTDYPEAALALGAQGQVVVRMTIDIQGRVAECMVVHSSGNPALDRRTCQNWQRSGRFRPAIGPDGQPVQAGIVRWVIWRIGGAGD